MFNGSREPSFGEGARTVSAASRLQYTYLAYLSKPKGERKLYRAIREHQPVRIVELGLRTIERTLHLIQVAQRFAGDQRIEYTGFDMFEARPSTQTALPLIVAHRQLKTTGARVKLIPGEPALNLRGAANSISQTDLLLICGSLVETELQDSWHYIPRMLHETSLVLQTPAPGARGASLVPLSRQEIDQRAAELTQRRRAA